MEIRDGWWLAAGLVIAFVFLVLGFGWGVESAAKDCKHFGKFRESAVIYRCTAVNGSERHG